MCPKLRGTSPKTNTKFDNDRKIYVYVINHDRLLYVFITIKINTNTSVHKSGWRKIMDQNQSIQVNKKMNPIGSISKGQPLNYVIDDDILLYNLNIYIFYNFII